MKKISLACIVDDDPIFVFGIKKMMKITSFCESFFICSNGKEALDKISAIIESGDNIPEVILLDLNMPIMDGWEFLDNFTKIDTPRKIVIYIVSSSISREDTQKAKQYSSITNFVIKPLEVKDIEVIKQQVIDEINN